MLSILTEWFSVLLSVLVFAATVLGLISLMDRGMQAASTAMSSVQSRTRTPFVWRRRAPTLSA